MRVSIWVTQFVLLEKAKKQRKSLKTVKRPAESEEGLNDPDEFHIQPPSPPRRVKVAKLSATEDDPASEIRVGLMTRLPSDLLFNSSEEAKLADVLAMPDQFEVEPISGKKEKEHDLAERNERPKETTSLCNPKPSTHPVDVVHFAAGKTCQDDNLSSFFGTTPPYAQSSPKTFSAKPLLEFEHVSPTPKIPAIVPKRKFLGLAKRKNAESPEDLKAKRFNGGSGTRFQVRISDREPQTVYVDETDMSDQGDAYEEPAHMPSSFVESSIPNERMLYHKPNPMPLKPGQDNHKMIMEMAYGYRTPASSNQCSIDSATKEMELPTTTELLALINESKRKSLVESEPIQEPKINSELKAETIENDKAALPDPANVVNLGEQLSECSLKETVCPDSKNITRTMNEKEIVDSVSVQAQVQEIISPLSSSRVFDDDPASFLEGVDAIEKEYIEQAAAKALPEVKVHEPSMVQIDDADDDALYESPATPNLPAAPEETVAAEPSLTVSDPVNTGNTPFIDTAQLPLPNLLSSAPGSSRSGRPIVFRLVKNFSYQATNEGPVSAMTLDQIHDLLTDMLEETGILNITFSN